MKHLRLLMMQPVAKSGKGTLKVGGFLTARKPYPAYQRFMFFVK